jgi:two-component system, NarL family, nitrate/nitrite response regulator NarL
MTKIFLADDHPMVQTALESLLRRRGEEIVGCATSGADALEEIASSDADVIILDVQMPGGSGIDVLSGMRKRGDNRPAMLLTAAISDETISKALALGVSGMVLKSTDPKMLIDAIDVVSKGGTWIDKALRDRVAAASSKAASPRRVLTDRQRELVSLVQQGLKNREIAERLKTTEGTVKAYLHTIFDKVGVENRTELAMKADQIIGQSGESDS